MLLIDPEPLVALGLAPFWLLWWLACFVTILRISGQAFHGVLYATISTLYLLLRYLGLGQAINGLLLLGITLTADWYWRQSHLQRK